MVLFNRIKADLWGFLPLIIIIAFPIFIAGCIGLSPDKKSSETIATYKTGMIFFLPDTNITKAPIFNKYDDSKSFYHTLLPDKIAVFSDGDWFDCILDNNYRFPFRLLSGHISRILPIFSYQVLDSSFIDYSVSLLVAHIEEDYGNYGPNIWIDHYYLRSRKKQDGDFSGDITIKDKDGGIISHKSIEEGLVNYSFALNRSTFSDLSKENIKNLNWLLTGKDQDIKDYDALLKAMESLDFQPPNIVKISFSKDEQSAQSLSLGEKYALNLELSRKKENIYCSASAPIKLEYEKMDLSNNDNSGLKFQREFFLAPEAFQSDSEKNLAPNIGQLEKTCNFAPFSGQLEINKRYFASNGGQLEKEQYWFFFDDNNNARAYRSPATVEKNEDLSLDFDFSGDFVAGEKANIIFDLQGNKKGNIFLKIVQLWDGEPILPNFDNQGKDSSNWPIYNIDKLELIGNKPVLSFIPHQFGCYGISAYFSDNQGKISAKTTKNINIALDIGHVDGDNIYPALGAERDLRFLVTYHNFEGGATLIGNNTVEVTINTGINEKGKKLKPIKKCGIYAKLTKTDNGNSFSEIKIMERADGIYKWATIFKSIGSYNASIAIIENSGATWIQDSKKPVVVVEKDKTPPEFTCQITNQDGDEKLRVGDYIRAIVKSSPPEARGELKIDIVISGSVAKSMQKTIDFDDFGVYDYISSDMISAKAQGVAVVGVAFVFAVELTDMAGNSSTKYIPGMIYESE